MSPVCKRFSEVISNYQTRSNIWESDVPFFFQNLHQELEAKFYEDTFDWNQVRNNDAAGLLKMFIRELPSPLFTVEYLPAFITLVESK